MADVIVKIQPFDNVQRVYITGTKYEDKSILETYDIKLNSLVDFLVDLKDIKTIHIMGNEEYIKAYVKEIKSKEMNKYNENKLEILINK